LNKKKIIVIGAGFGGLAVANLLARDGFSVTVIEKNSQAGGRAQVWREKGFVYDMGPSWYLMPEVFENYFSIFGKKISDLFELKRLDPNYRVFFGDSAPIDIPSSMDGIEKVFEGIEPGSAKKLRRYLEAAKYQYDIAMKEFLYRDFSSVMDFFDLRLITQGLRLHIFESVDKFARRYFKSDKLRKVLEYTMVFLGGSPDNTPALYSIMSHVDFGLGVWYPMGGMGRITEALEKVASENGVEIRLSEEVKKIKVSGGRVCGVETDLGSYPCDLVVVNADYEHAESKLLDKEWRSFGRRYWESRKMGPSAYLIYLGLNKRIKGLQHHNLYLDEKWSEHFDTIFKRPQWPDNPSFYVSCPSKTDPSVAPEGCENLFVLVPVAAGIEDLPQIREKYFNKTIAHLEKLCGDSIKDSIIVKRDFAHNDFIREYNSYKGTSLGLSHTLFQTAVFRPARKSKKADGLYYCGAYNHPGIGVPMVLISAQICASSIKEKYAGQSS